MSTIDLKETVHEETDEFFRYSTGIPFPLLNAVIDSHIPLEIAIKRIKENIAFFGKRQVPFFWMIGPSSSPKNMGELLIKSGFTPDKQPGMAYNLKTTRAERELSNKVEIIKIENLKTLKVWEDVVLTGFDLPKDLLSDFFHKAFSFMLLNDRLSASAFLGYYDKKPVASSLVCYEAGVAGIYNVTTLEEARGKGIGSAITLAPLNEAKKLGYEIAILHSSEMAFNMYKRMGFKEYCTIELYVWQPDLKE
ncbi:hypothetical protein LCGC14_1291340 [marine sediment metagenome]|uniref:N-acetyltransferase domain-containing protein n=1 Tax=marine sediment metagenome TaxID=412755 RepID=A0A0F9NV86_9ZZZZ|nr:N-acetyltransferase [bacterium]